MKDIKDIDFDTLQVKFLMLKEEVRFLNYDLFIEHNLVESLKQIEIIEKLLTELKSEL